MPSAQALPCIRHGSLRSGHRGFAERVTLTIRGPYILAASSPDGATQHHVPMAFENLANERHPQANRRVTRRVWGRTRVS